MMAYGFYRYKEITFTVGVLLKHIRDNSNYISQQFKHKKFKCVVQMNIFNC